MAAVVEAGCAGDGVAGEVLHVFERGPVRQ